MVATISTAKVFVNISVMVQRRLKRFVPYKEFQKCPTIFGNMEIGKITFKTPAADTFFDWPVRQLTFEMPQNVLLRLLGVHIFRIVPNHSWLIIACFLEVSTHLR